MRGKCPDATQVAVALGVVQAVLHHESVGNVEAKEPRIDCHLHCFGWGLPHPLVVFIEVLTHRAPVPRIQILLTLMTVALAGLAAPMTQARGSIIDEPRLVATIPVGDTPYGIAVTPDGSKVFVSNSEGGSVSVIDTSRRIVTSTITSNIGTTPVGIAINPSGTTAYVGNFTFNLLNPGPFGGTVTSIDIATETTSSHLIWRATGQSCDRVLNLTVSFDGSKLFVACQDDGRVQVLDLPGLATGSLLANTGNNCFPTDSAVTSDDRTLVVAVNGVPTGGFSCDSSQLDTALIIDIATAPTGNTSESATGGAFSVAISPTSGLSYLAGRSSGAIAVVNPTTKANLGADIAVGGTLEDIVITPDGSQAIVSVIDQHAVKFVDLATGVVTHTVGVGGSNPQSIALSRDGRFLYTANRSGSVGVIEVPVPPTPLTSSDGTPMYALQLSTGSDAMCSTKQIVATRGSWINLPESSTCFASIDGSSPTLLGWATSEDFPIEIARRQVDNGWGAYETFHDDGTLSGVFIPAGGATLLSATGRLYAIWSSPVGS